MRAWRAGAIAVVLLLAWTGSTRAATLDVVDEGDDLVFTWDSGLPDDLLRGTTPDNLTPWLAGVTSPLRVPGENVVRGENAYYRLASGSNMAFRIERTFEPPSLVDNLLRPPPATLPERRQSLDAAALFARWPTLTEVLWYDGSQARYESLSRLADGSLIGDAETLPPHGAVWLGFDSTTTVTLVGSADDSYPGPELADLSAPDALLAIPLDSRRWRALDVLCGDPGVDWFDADGDGLPDECGTDSDADGRPDTGLFGPDTLAARTVNPSCALSYSQLPEGPMSAVVVYVVLTRRFSFLPTSASAVLTPGGAFSLATSSSRPDLNLPFRPPRW